MVFSTASEVWPRFTHINPQLQYSYHTGRCGDGVGPGRLSCVSVVKSVPFGHGWGWGFNRIALCRRCCRLQPFDGGRAELGARDWQRYRCASTCGQVHGRSGNRRARMTTGSAVNDAQQRAQQLQQAEDAQKRLQEAEAAQKRIQQMQETVAAQQRRVQQVPAARCVAQESSASASRPLKPGHHRTFPLSPSRCRRARRMPIAIGPPSRRRWQEAGTAVTIPTGGRRRGRMKRGRQPAAVTRPHSKTLWRNSRGASKHPGRMRTGHPLPAGTIRLHFSRRCRNCAGTIRLRATMPGTTTGPTARHPATIVKPHRATRWTGSGVAITATVTTETAAGPTMAATSRASRPCTAISARSCRGTAACRETGIGETGIEMATGAGIETGTGGTGMATGIETGIEADIETGTGTTTGKR